MFQLENEEMVCTDCPVNYDKLNELYVEQSSIDQEKKLHSYSTLIPPPCDEEGIRGMHVYIIELNVDLSCDIVSPHTIQDPVYVNYDKDMLNICLSEPLLCFDDSLNVRQKWHRQVLLASLNGVMKDYGCVESTQCFSTFKYNLLSVCNASSDLFYDGRKLFYENFILDIVVHCLRHVMKNINDRVVRLWGQCLFRPIFSPSVLSMLKVLNSLCRAFELQDELTSLELMNEKTGSMVGALIEERKDLLNKANASIVFMRRNYGKGFWLDDAFKGDKMVNDSHELMNELQTKMTVFQVLFYVYKVLSIELHRGECTSFFTCCPMCTDGYLMKEELQTLIDSVRECLPIENVLIDNEEDLLHHEKMFPSSMMFTESQCSNGNFVQSFVMQANISRQSSNCDLVPMLLRGTDTHTFGVKDRRCFAGNVTYEPPKKVNDAIDDLSNRCLMTRVKNLSQSFISVTDHSKTHIKVKQLDNHLSSDCHYNPFRVVNMSGDDKFHLVSFFASIRHKHRYQSADRSRTFTKGKHDCLIYDDDYLDRHRLCNGLLNIHKQLRHGLAWREQFDHAPKDFLSSVHHENRDNVLDSLQSSVWTRLQKWWEIFGKYWLISNCHNDDDVKLMGWLMNGANHGTIDVCGENVSNMCPVMDCKWGIRLLKSSALDNHSKLLKMELGQQIPIKSSHKIKRDIGKRRQTLSNSPVLRSNSFDHCYWYDQRVRKVSSLNACGPIEYSLPNSRWGFFDECVTQKFSDTDLGQASLISYRDENNNIMGDIYSNASSYQCHCMDISGELMTFCVGGPRYFENNLPLENSPLWTEKNLAYDTHMKDVFRDCKYVYGSPLFRIHYEYPTNPSLKGIVVNDPDNWWDIEERDSDIFEDPNEYGYVSTQLMHLPNYLGYNFGNVLSYLPIYDLALSNELMYTRKCIKLKPCLLHGNVLCQAKMLPLKFRMDQVAVAQ